MKFASQDARYLARRTEVSEALGPCELWSVIDQWPLYVGLGNLARTFAISDLFRESLDVPGDVAEFGTWRGATLMLLTKMLRIFSPNGPKVVHCFDTFEGLQAFTPEDGKATTDTGLYRGDLDTIRAITELYDLGDDVEFHQGLIEDTLPALLEARPELMFSFVYCDTDLYQSTATVLEHITARLMPGGLIVFDEWNYANYPGEGIAVNEYLGSNHGQFTVAASPNARQPSLALRKNP